MLGDIDLPGYHAFFEALVAGRLKLGQTLNQRELASILGLTLSPMRELTTLLEAEGLIVVRRKVGITIFYPDVRFVGNSFQFRGLLEREGLRKFARSVDSGWIERMRAEHARIMQVVRAKPDQSLFRFAVRELEDSFHGTFITAYDNDQISVTYARLSQKMYLIRLHNLQAVGFTNTVRSLEEHLAIIDALDRHDPDAAVDALDKHLQGVLHRVLTT